MKRHILWAWLAALLLATTARADPIAFFDVQYEATTVALTTDGPAGFSTQAGLLGPDPVSLSADSVGTSDVATAGAVVGFGLLTTSADVSAGAIASAVASAQFTGSFINAGPVSLFVDFTSLDVASGSGGGATTLFVSLISDGVTLFSDFVDDAWQFTYVPLLGSTSVLGLTLSSEASAAFLSAGPGNASSFGLVTVTGTVPEVATWLLCSLGLSLLAAVRARASRRP